MESSKSSLKADAVRLLKMRQAQVVTGKFVLPDRKTMGDLFTQVVEDYAARECHSLYETKLRFEKHLTPFFGKIRVSDFITHDARRYVQHRQQAEARPALR